MSLQIEIPPELEKALAAKAARLGVPVERYATGVLRRDLEATTEIHPPERERVVGTRQTARRTLESLAAGTRAGLPPIPDEALTSESIYAGRGEVDTGE